MLHATKPNYIKTNLITCLSSRLTHLLIDNAPMIDCHSVRMTISWKESPALDGKDIVIISATGSGKLAYIYMLTIVLLKLANNPSLSPIKKKLPADPAVAVVCPTTALGVDLVAQEGKMQGYGFKAINGKGRQVDLEIC